MRSHLLSAATLGLAALTLSPAIATAATDPSGVWLDDKGRGAVEIKPCGNSLCGYVVWVKEANDNRGCGKQILGDVSQAGNVWGNGWIYSPEKKKRYNVELKMLKDDQLRVKGYAGTKFFSKTMIWTKAPPDIGRCDVANLEPGATPAPVPKADEVPKAPSVKPEAVTPAPQPKGPETATAPAEGKPATVSPAKPKEPVTPQKNSTAGATPEPGQKSAQAATDVPIESGPDLSDLPIDKYFKKSADGRCKLNLPWVKLDFACPDGG